MEAKTTAQPSSLGRQDWETLADAGDFPEISGVPGPSTQSSSSAIPTVTATNGIINDEVLDEWSMAFPSQPPSSEYYASQLHDLFPAPGSSSNNPQASRESALTLEDNDFIGESPPATSVDSAGQPNHTAQSTGLDNGTFQNTGYDVNISSSINPVPGGAPVTPMNTQTPAPVTSQLPNQLTNNIQAKIMLDEVEVMRMMLRAEEEERQQRTDILQSIQAILRAQEDARARRAYMIRVWGEAMEKRPQMD